MGGGQEETQVGGDLTPLTLWQPLAPYLRQTLWGFALTRGSPTSPPPPPPPTSWSQSQGWGWTRAGAGLGGGSPHDPAHSSGDTLLSKILIPGPTHAFPQARLPGPAPCSLYGPAQGHTLRPQDPLPPSSRPRPTQDSGQTSPWPHGPSLGSAMSWPRPATQAPPMPRP